MDVFLQIPDATVQNAWLLCQSFSNHDNRAMNLTSFQRQVVNIYRMKYLSRQQSHIFSPGDVTLFRGTFNERRLRKFLFDGIKYHPLSNRTQCPCFYCGKKSKSDCPKCDIGLHIDCF